MNAWIGSDSLAFISLAGLRAAVPDARCQGFCDACFTGDYPTSLTDMAERGADADQLPLPVGTA